MSEVIQTGRFVIMSERNKKRVYIKSLDNDLFDWTENIKDATIFASEKLAIMFKYSSEVGECKIQELINKK